MGWGIWECLDGWEFVRIDDVIGGKIWWQKMKCFVKLFSEKRLHEVGVCVPPPPYTSA
jgi:hypothetical protein